MALDPKLTKYSTASQVLASFSSTELASGLLVQNYFLTISKTSAGEITEMISDEINSALTDKDVNTEQNFDTGIFNIPRTVKGTCRVTGTMEHQAAGAGDVTFRLLKVASDGSTETALSSAITTHDPSAGDNVPVYFSVPLPLTETIIAEGEKLRLEVVDGGSGNGTIWIGTSPTDQDGSVITPSDTDSTTITRVTVPFKVE